MAVRKDPAQRARGNKPPAPSVTLTFNPGTQPELPSFQVSDDNGLHEYQWPAATRDWWQMWAESAQAESFTATDWSFLLDTAVIHAKLWMGNAAAAAELRLRVAKFGATPEDRARLRMQFAQADEADGKRRPSVSAEYRGVLRGLPSAVEVEPETG